MKTIITTNAENKTFTLRTGKSTTHNLAFGDIRTRVSDLGVSFYLKADNSRLAAVLFKNGISMDGEDITRENADKKLEILTRNFRGGGDNPTTPPAGDFVRRVSSTPQEINSDLILTEGRTLGFRDIDGNLRNGIKSKSKTTLLNASQLEAGKTYQTGNNLVIFLPSSKEIEYSGRIGQIEVSGKLLDGTVFHGLLLLITDENTLWSHMLGDEISIANNAVWDIQNSLLLPNITEITIISNNFADGFAETSKVQASDFLTDLDALDIYAEFGDRAIGANIESKDRPTVNKTEQIAYLSDINGGQGGAFNDSHLIPKSDFGNDSPEPNYVWINGVAWATRNLDIPKMFVEDIHDIGHFYQWGQQRGWSPTDPMTASDGTTTWNPSASGTQNEFWNEADLCPDGYRLPTEQEIESLLSVESEWAQVGGQWGRWYGNPNEERVFFPAGGQRENTNGNLVGAGANGNYWRNQGTIGASARNLNFTQANAGQIQTMPRARAFSLRLVAKNPSPQGVPDIHDRLGTDFTVSRDGKDIVFRKNFTHFDKKTNEKVNSSENMRLSMLAGNVRMRTLTEDDYTIDTETGINLGNYRIDLILKEPLKQNERIILNATSGNANRINDDITSFISAFYQAMLPSIGGVSRFEGQYREFNSGITPNIRAQVTVFVAPVAQGGIVQTNIVRFQPNANLIFSNIPISGNQLQFDLTVHSVDIIEIME